jgi:predicted ABC-type ATPase
VNSSPPSAASAERPRLLVVAGPNGAGKTSVTEQGLRHEWFSGCLYINPDDLARERFGDWNSPDAVLHAARLAEKMREDALRKRADIAFETVLSTEGKIDYLRRARDAGYFIRLFFVGTESPAINVTRITRRFLKGGHEVPLSKIVSRFQRSMTNSIRAARIADRAYFYDNTAENENARLLFRCKNGRVEKNYAGEPPGWAAPIRRALGGG